MIAAPLLLLLIISHRPEVFKWLLAISFSTDAIDGYFARKHKVISKLGAKLDSIADDLTIAVAIIGMSVFKPEFLRQEITLIITTLALFVLQTVFAVFRYKKMSSFHTYGAKIAAILQGIFLLLLFFLDEPVYILFYITVAVTAIELVEEIIIVLLLPQWEANVKGLYWVIRKRQSE
jgi:cardiolipin synthase